jgi:hypothetical protein
MEAHYRAEEVHNGGVKAHNRGVLNDLQRARLSRGRNGSLPFSNVSKLDRRQTGRLRKRDNLLPGVCLMINKFLIFSTQIWITRLGTL